jgi:hypothetical protein
VTCSKQMSPHQAAAVRAGHARWRGSAIWVCRMGVVGSVYGAVDLPGAAELPAVSTRWWRLAPSPYDQQAGLRCRTVWRPGRSRAGAGAFGGPHCGFLPPGPGAGPRGTPWWRLKYRSSVTVLACHGVASGSVALGRDGRIGPPGTYIPDGPSVVRAG